MPKDGKVLTKARKRFISSLSKNVIVVVIAAAFGGEVLSNLSSGTRGVVIVAIGLGVLTLFVIGVWLAVDDKEGG